MGNQQGQTDLPVHQPHQVARFRCDMSVANLVAEHVYSDQITAGTLTFDALKIGNPKDGYVVLPVQKVKQLLTFLNDCPMGVNRPIDRPIVMLGDNASHELPLRNNTPPPPYEESV